jgi:signal transduction histidine kinase
MKGYFEQPGSPRQALLRYGLAVACVVAAVLVGLLVEPVLDASVLLLVSVLVSAWFSGLWPAFMASILATLALDYYFTPPLYTLTLEFVHFPRLAVFSLLAAFCASASAARRRAERSLQHARDQLEIRVQERTAELRQSNEQLKQEIAERRRAESALEDLAGRLIDAQEQERSRIGRELHDHISQTLGILTIEIDQLQTDGRTAPTVSAALHNLRQRVSEITDDVHQLSHRLHSSTLDYLGLTPALQRMVEEFSQRHDIAIGFSHATLPVPLPSDVALCLFRIVEEALTNIAKHSNARSAEVRVTGTSDGIHLVVEDAGIGFDSTGVQRNAGLGFVSMQERLRVLRGTVSVESAPSRGTRIEVFVPSAALTTGSPDELQPATSTPKRQSTVSQA